MPQLDTPVTTRTIASVLQQLRSRQLDPVQLVNEARRRMSTNLSANTYLCSWPVEERAEHQIRDTELPLYSIPCSIKDCFDVRNHPTSVGTHFCAQQNGNAHRDSGLVHQLDITGSVVLGKTHLHPLAYGITGENADYGDCLQCGTPARLTGGSSSGAAASVQEGSAMFALGTDTGGSIRVPAVLCGLVGFRTSLGVGSWAGGHHLAPSFDTIGMMYRHLSDTPRLAAAIFGIADRAEFPAGRHVGFADERFLADCPPEIKRSQAAWVERFRSIGWKAEPFDTSFLEEAYDIFAPLQAKEAATIHQGHFANFEATIAERLDWGWSLAEGTINQLEARQREFNERVNRLWDASDLLLLPVSPYSVLPAGADHSKTRAKILRYTTPASLGGLPALALPGAAGAGCQLWAPRFADSRLVAAATLLGALSSVLGP